MTDITMRQMLEAGVHFGHQVQFWNPKMAPYIFCAKNKIHIINLEKTLPLYEEAVNFLSSIAAKRGKILFVGTKQQARELIKAEAERCQMPYVDFRWLGGMLTNYKTIRQSLKRLMELEALRDSPTFARLTKKEALSIMREITKLERGLGGIRKMGGLPDALLVIDVGNEHIAVSEATKLRIPIVGIVDTNNNPEGIDYVIPGNDDSTRAIKLYLQGIVDAIVEARSHIVAEEAMAEKQEAQGGKKVLVPKQPKKKVIKKPSSSTEAPSLASTEQPKAAATSDKKAAPKTIVVKSKVLPAGTPKAASLETGSEANLQQSEGSEGTADQAQEEG